MNESCDTKTPHTAAEAVLVTSKEVPVSMCKIKGLNYEQPQITLSDLLQSFQTSGFQASNLWKVVGEVNRMIEAKEKSLQREDTSKTDGKIWLSFTSNMISSGLREAFVFLAKNKLVDVIVTTAGGIEEDLIKCLADTYLGDFKWKGSDLRAKGWNRAGNLIIPNENYCRFEDWLKPILDKMLEEQKASAESPSPVIWTPSTMIDRLGQEINDQTSLLYWCHHNHIPVFCPGLTDGSLGDNLYFHSYQNAGLILDIVNDIRRINDIALRASVSGMIILGGGLPKHHTCNANLMRNGADYAVYINTAQEYDGCDSGATPDEAVSWGKIRTDATPIKVFGDASILFPLVVAETFVKHQQKKTNRPIHKQINIQINK